MIPIDQMTIGELASTLRDLTAVVAMITIGWKTRDWLQPIFDFFKRANGFMTSMENNMNILLNNHMKHIESDIRRMSGRDYDHFDEPEVLSRTHYASREQSTTDSDGDSRASSGRVEREE